MSHRSLRSSLVPLATGLAVAVAVFAVAGSIGFGAASPGPGYGTVNAARAITLAADISSAAPRPAHAALQPALTAPRPAAGGTLAGSVVRDTVAALGVLIVLVIVLLLIMSSRRRRALAGSASTGRARSHRGQHGHRRTDQDLRGTQPLRPVQHPGPAEETGRPARHQPSTPVPAVSWPAPGGWQGGSVGEIAQPPAAPARPAITPVARPTTASRSSAGMPSGPPWAPAQAPENTFGPLPVAPASSFRPVPGGGIRVPPDVTGPSSAKIGPAARRPGAFDPPVLPGSADSSAWPPLFDYTAPSPASASSSPAPAPAFPTTAMSSATPATPDLGAATIPGFPRLEAGRDAADPGVTRPIPAAEEFQRGLGLAAAPVAAGYPTTHPPSYDRPEVPATPAGSHSWDLAATDVFPVTSSEPAAGPDEDAPGASGS